MSNQDRAEGKDYRDNFRLWFFRDLTDAERQKLYRVCGLPVQELGTHGSQRHALDIIWPATPQAPGGDTPGGSVSVADVAISQGSFGQEDGSRIIGWRVSAETSDAMGMASMCLPREIGEDLERLRAIATWWQSGSTQRKDKLTLILNDTFPDDRPMRRHLWDQLLPLIDAIVSPAESSGGDAVDWRALAIDTAANLRRMANDEFAECEQVRLETVIERLESAIASGGECGG